MKGTIRFFAGFVIAACFSFPDNNWLEYGSLIVGATLMWFGSNAMIKDGK